MTTQYQTEHYTDSNGRECRFTVDSETGDVLAGEVEVNGVWVKMYNPAWVYDSIAS